MTDKEKLIKIKKLADAMYYAAQYLTTDASRLHKAMDEYHKFSIHECKEEPVSEDLEEAAKNVGQKYFPDEYNIWARPNYEAVKVECAFKDGANWQKAQDQSIIELAEDHAMLAGMEKMKEQLMAEAIDVEVKMDAGGYPYIDKTIELYDYDKNIPIAKEGEKYKVVLIKED